MSLLLGLFGCHPFQNLSYVITEMTSVNLKSALFSSWRSGAGQYSYPGSWQKYGQRKVGLPSVRLGRARICMGYRSSTRPYLQASLFQQATPASDLKSNLLPQFLPPIFYPDLTHSAQPSAFLLSRCIHAF